MVHLTMSTKFHDHVTTTVYYHYAIYQYKCKTLFAITIIRVHTSNLNAVCRTYKD